MDEDGRLDYPPLGDPAWRTDELPTNGTEVLVKEVRKYRYKHYEPGSRQARGGLLGRWQVLNIYGGWSNSGEPNAIAWVSVTTEDTTDLT